MDIIVIGGGASGLMAAIHAAINGANVTIVESGKKPGKKLSITGNGKCNFTNDKLRDITITDIKNFYRGDNGFVFDVLSTFSMNDTITFFKHLGVYSYMDSVHGGYYPLSNQASSVTNALINYAEKLGVKIKSNNTVKSVAKTDDGFIVDVGIKLKCDKLILATGGYYNDMNGLSGFKIAEMFGHHIQELRPALTALIAKDILNKASGTRIYGSISLESGEKHTGEIQITDYGISGIPVFDASHSVYENDTVYLNFIPKLLGDQSTEGFSNKLFRELITYQESRLVFDLLCGMIPEKLLNVIFEKLKLTKSLILNNAALDSIINIFKLLSNYPLAINKRRGFDFAQVMQGGIVTDEINPSTMESKKCKRLYFCGEMIDVYGICGGYNLQWAWSSGYIAGNNSSK